MERRSLFKNYQSQNQGYAGSYMSTSFGGGQNSSVMNTSSQVPHSNKRPMLPIRVMKQIIDDYDSSSSDGEEQKDA